ncbi:tyrosine-type recombinase/integrase [Kitasatospora saccharophila]|uniref:Tyrosine-type recombinase/integrase n=1 Tax=Kitasatospora saccharophila TaxID=407973 RepID=A0ABN2W8N8_9ACTN
MSTVHTYKRCGCVGPLIRRRGEQAGQPILDKDGNPQVGRLDTACTELSKNGHGTWYYSLRLVQENGEEPIRLRKGGFPTQAKAKEEAKSVWDDHDAGLDVTVEETFGDYLLRWAGEKEDVARTTISKYLEHIRYHIAPAIGRVERRAIRKSHLLQVFAAIKDRNTTILAHHEYVAHLTVECERKRKAWREGIPSNRQVLRASWHEARELLASERKRKRRVTGLETQKRILATLSSAIADGVRAEEFRRNWADLVKLPKSSPPKPMLWTPARVARWRETGKIPGRVMVWTPELTGAFLDFVADDNLFDLWHFMALRGPRRGEACGLSWSEVDLDSLTVTINSQVVSVNGELCDATPKADSERILSIDSESGRLFESRRVLQVQQRATAGKAWHDTGRVFTHEDGTGYHPDYLTHRFKDLVAASGLPPITLHGLRHGAACIAHLGGSDMKEISDQLGHSAIQITMDTYTNILPEAQKARAEAALAVVPRAGQVPAAPDPAAVSVPATPAAPPVPAVPAPAPDQVPAFNPAAPELRPAGGGRLATLRRVRAKRTEQVLVGV